MIYRCFADIEGAKMSTAMEIIVETYVRMRNRRALDELMMHRHRLAIDMRLRKHSNYDLSLIICQMAEDVKAIAKGLAQLDALAVLPDLSGSYASPERRSALGGGADGSQSRLANLLGGTF